MFEKDGEDEKSFRINPSQPLEDEDSESCEDESLASGHGEDGEADNVLPFSRNGRNSDCPEYDENSETEEGSVGPGRGRHMVTVPLHSVHTILSKEKRRQLAVWAISHVRMPGMEEDAFQAIQFAFSRHAIPAGTKHRDVEKAARTTAKRFCLEEKRKLAFPMTLDRKDFFNKDVRDSCFKTDADVGLNRDLGTEENEELVEHISEEGFDFEAIDWTKVPPKLSVAIDKVWHEVNPRVRRVVRHVLMGESIERAADLEAIAVGTAASHMRAFAVAAQRAI